MDNTGNTTTEKGTMRSMLQDDLDTCRILEANLLEIISKQNKNVANMTATMLSIMDGHLEKAVLDITNEMDVLKRRKEYANMKTDIMISFLNNMD